MLVISAELFPAENQKIVIFAGTGFILLLTSVSIFRFYDVEKKLSNMYKSQQEGKLTRPIPREYPKVEYDAGPVDSCILTIFGMVLAITTARSLYLLYVLGHMGGENIPIVDPAWWVSPTAFVMGTLLFMAVGWFVEFSNSLEQLSVEKSSKQLTKDGLMKLIDPRLSAKITEHDFDLKNKYLVATYLKKVGQKEVNLPKVIAEVCIHELEHKIESDLNESIDKKERDEEETRRKEREIEELESKALDYIRS